MDWRDVAQVTLSLAEGLFRAGGCFVLCSIAESGEGPWNYSTFFQFTYISIIERSKDILVYKSAFAIR